MPFEPLQFEQTHATPRYDQPDWADEAEVARAWLPVNRTVGWLVLQGESALVLLTNISPERADLYAIRRVIEDQLRIGAEKGIEARETWNAIRKDSLFKAPELLNLGVLTEELRDLWGVRQ